MAYDWPAHHAEAQRQGDDREKAGKSWEPGDLVAFDGGRALCLSHTPKGVLWILSNGLVNLSNPKNNYLFVHRVALLYPFTDPEQIKKDFAKGVFDHHFIS